MKKWTLRHPKKGDIIRVDFNNYHHYGIYVSDDEVIQFGLIKDVILKKEDIKVLKSNINEFRNNKFVEVRNYTLKEKIIKNRPNKVINIARSKMGLMGYDIINNNCCHFVNMCVFNKNIMDE